MCRPSMRRTVEAVSPQAPAGAVLKGTTTLLPRHQHASELESGGGSVTALGRDTLYSVIGAVVQGPELERVLPAIVDLLSEATACHACFVYLMEGERLRMRAASNVFSGAVGTVSLSVEEGICGWVVRNDEPVFIREGSMSDPRMKVVPELREEQFQSMVAVPLRADRAR